MGNFLKREEATALLREIIAACGGLDEEAVMLMLPNAADPLSHGYQLHIKTSATDNFSCIKSIVEKHDLAVSNEPEKSLIVIYQPMIDYVAWHKKEKSQ